MTIDGNISGEVLKGGHGTAMLLKLLLFLLMAGVHFFRGKVLAPCIAKTQSDGEKSRLQKLSQSGPVEFWVRAGGLTSLCFCRSQVADFSPFTLRQQEKFSFRDSVNHG
jgi:hypothetical protein